MGLYRQLQNIAEFIAFALAMAGGLVLVIITVLNCASIIGRALDPLDLQILSLEIAPIRGIYDMTEIAMAAAVFGFLPWAHLREAHARVDLFQPFMAKTFERFFDLLFNVAMAVFASVMCWRLYLGMQDKLSYGETTFIAQILVWKGYAAGLVGAIGFVLIALFCVLRASRRLAGRED